MSLFLKRFGLFIIPIFVVAFALELTLRAVPNDYAFKKNYLDLNARQINVLFLGSSHAFYGIDPQHLKVNGYNAAYVSQTLLYDQAILKKYEGQWDQLKYIVLAVDYFSLYNNLGKSVESWRVKNYNIYWKIDDSDKIVDRTELFGNKPNVSANKLIGHFVKHEPAITSSELGRGPKRVALGDDEFKTAGAAAAKRHTYDLKYFDENLQILKSIVDFAKKNNIKVLLYTSPADPTYYENLDAGQLQRNSEVLQEIDTENEHVRYVDLLRDPSFTRSDFWDPDHLNETGAQKLTIRIDSLIR